jgi:protein PsiE
VTPPDDNSSKINPLTGHEPDHKSDTAALIGFRFIERALLIVAAAMTIGATCIEIAGVYRAQTITLADILLIFLYTEVMGMIAVFYTGRGSPFVYPIFIAVTALARLIVLQGKDMAPENILFEAAAILLLAIAAVIIIRAGKGSAG